MRDSEVESDARYTITWLVRRLFRAMSATTDAYLAESGFSAADRAVVEFLYPDRQLSVPEIAALYDVSRQHVQVTINRLVDGGLIVAVENPRHKRSPLYSLDDAGRAAFAEIRKREAALLADLFRNVDERDIAITRRTLETLLDRLKETEEIPK